MKSDLTIYRLTGDATPPAWKLATRHTHRKPLLQYDEEKDESRALRYATNQRSFYEDEQKGEVVLAQVWFDEGQLTIQKTNPTLRKFMEIHPDNVANGGSKFYKEDKSAVAKSQEEQLDRAFEAETLARSISFDKMVAIHRSAVGETKSSQAESSEIKRDIKVWAKNDPEWFLQQVDSEEVESNNDIERILEAKLIQLRATGVFWQLDDNKKRMISIPHGKTPREAVEDYFHDGGEGTEAYKLLLSMID